MAKHSLQEITDAYGNWVASQHGTSLHWSESTNYGNHSQLDGWHQYQVNPSDQQFTYDPAAPAPIPGELDTQAMNYDNGTTAAQSVTYSVSETTQQTFNWSVTDTL